MIELKIKVETQGVSKRAKLVYKVIIEKRSIAKNAPVDPTIFVDTFFSTKALRGFLEGVKSTLSYVKVYSTIIPRLAEPPRLVLEGTRRKKRNEK